MVKAKAYAAVDERSALAPYEIERRDPGPEDVQIQILFCGVCHSDLHTARNEWKNTLYPSVPGHEIVGRVVAVGNQVTKFKVGDLAGVGCLVDSCGHCPSCHDGEEQYCDNGFTGTYNGPLFGGENTYGGYSQTIVVKESFVLRIRHAEKDLASVAPLLCAGITTYSPLRHWGAGPGKKVGIVGLGGLGHMGVKIAHAMGAHVVLFTTSASKVADGKRLGADEVCISTDPDAMARYHRPARFHPQHRGGAARPRCLSATAQAGRHDDPGRRPGRGPSVAECLRADPEAAQHRRFAHRRHSRDAGNARLLCRARPRLGHRTDPDELHQHAPTTGC